jgi:hypothetical protein
MWYACKRREEKCTKFCWEGLNEGDRSVDQGIVVWCGGGGGDRNRMALREIGWGAVERIRLAQDRDRWQFLVNAVMNLWVLVARS